MEEISAKLTDCWNSSDDLSQLELVQDGSLTSGIKTNLESLDEHPQPQQEENSSKPSVYL